MKYEKKQNSMNIQKKSKKKRLFYSRMAGLDALMSALFFVSLLYLCIILIPLGVVPTAWIMLGILVAVILILLNLIMSLVRQPMRAHWIRRGMVALLIGLGVFVTHTIQTVDKAIGAVIKLPDSMNEYVSILTLRSSKIIGLDDLTGKKIGIQRFLDTEHMDIAIQHLDQEELNYQTQPFDDYASAVKALYNKEIGAIVMSESYRTLVEETYEDFKAKTAIIDAAVIAVPIIEIVKPIDVRTNAFTVLVSGIDTLGKATVRSQSDANMIITINPLSKLIVMNSIPRDAYLPNACLNNGYDKLTHTGMLGIDCTVKTIENALDIEINYYARITFSSVIDVIDALGGIDVNVPMDFCERPANRSFTKNNIIYVKKGQQVLSGVKSLALARHRKTLNEGDLGRAKNQQLVVNAMIKKVASPDLLSKIDPLVQVISETVQTNLTKKEIYGFVNHFASDFTPWSFSNHVISGENDFGETASMPGSIKSIVRLTADDVASIKYIIKTAMSDADLSTFSFTTNDIKIQKIDLDGETTGAEGGDYCHL